MTRGEQADLLALYRVVHEKQKPKTQTINQASNAIDRWSERMKAKAAERGE